MKSKPTTPNAASNSEARTKRRVIPIKVVPPGKTESPNGYAPTSIAQILWNQTHFARTKDAHCLRGSLLPQHRRMLQQRHGDSMIIGDICTRRRPFCDSDTVGPICPTRRTENLAESVSHEPALRRHHLRRPRRPARRRRTAFRRLHQAIHVTSPNTKIEILVPDFRGRLDITLKILAETPPDVMNHNLETHPSLYRKARPGANYQHSLDLLNVIKKWCRTSRPNPHHGRLKETDEDVREIKARDGGRNNIEMITIDKQSPAFPERTPCSVLRHVTPEQFKIFEKKRPRTGSATPPSARWHVPATTPTNRLPKPLTRKPRRLRASLNPNTVPK